MTQKVPLTLSEDEWQCLDEQAKGNRSQFLRHIVWDKRSPESTWDNYACLGYAIAGAEKAGLVNEQIKTLIRSIYGEFDWKTVEQANKIYRESQY